MTSLLILLRFLLMCGCVRSASVAMASTSSPSSSSSSDEFAKPAVNAGRFENPSSFKNWGGIPGFGSILKWQFFEKNHENVPSDEKELNKTIPVHSLKEFVSNGPSKLFATWLGHATVLVNIEGANFLTDPVWSKRASFTSFSGPKRYRPPPMELDDLPRIDFAVISHDHYDHLDAAAVAKINEMNPEIRWFVPLGMKNWMKTIGVESSDQHPNRVTEMNWGQNTTVSVHGVDYTIWCLPAQHWGQRGPFDRNWRLWSGWAVLGPSRRFYYTGDTGFCDEEFRKIGERLGPFDLAAIPIGAYEPRWFMKSQHINPEEAIQLHELVRSKMSLGIHWGTYHMGSYEYYLEPKEKLGELMEQKKDVFPFITEEMGVIWQEKEEDGENSEKKTKSG